MRTRSSARVAVLSPLLALMIVLTTSALSSAAPTADFTMDTSEPAVGQPVTFTFTGSCDVPPCRIQWRWFKTGGSSSGTSMGEGEQIPYAFPAPGTYSVTAKITNATPSHGSATATHALVVHDTYQDTDRRVSLSTWEGVFSPAASGGGYRRGTGRAALRFSGPRVKYVAITGPQQGIAEVRIDGHSARALDLYSPTPGTRSLILRGLSDAIHRIVVRGSGTRNPASSGDAVSLDEFVVGAAHVDDTSTLVTYDAWQGRQTAGGSQRITALSGETVSLQFTGTSLTWLTATGPDHGRARVTIDGVIVGRVDNWSASAASGVERTFGGLGDGQHDLRLVVLGTHRAASTGNRVVVDAFVAQ